MLIDAIKPDGDAERAVYDYGTQVNAQHDPFEPFLGGELQADVAIYYDKDSMYDPDLQENGLSRFADAGLQSYGFAQSESARRPSSR